MATSIISAPVSSPSLPSITQCSSLDDIKTYITAQANSSLGKASVIRFQAATVINGFTRWGLYTGILFANDTNYYDVLIASQFGDALLIAYSQGTWVINNITVSQLT